MIKEHARKAPIFIGFSGLAVLLGRYTSEGPRSAILAATIPLAIVSLFVPYLVLTGAVALLPFSNAVPANLGGLQVSTTDLLLAVGLGGLVLAALSNWTVAGTGYLSTLAPTRPIVLTYFATVLVTIAAHPTSAGVSTAVQRVELVVVAMIVGAALADRQVLRRALWCYLGVAAVLAITAILTTLSGNDAGAFLNVQKNPAGQALAAALLISIAIDRVPARPLWIGLFSLGVLASLSRGAILGVLIALLVMVLLRGRGTRLRDLTALALVTIALFGAFQALTPSQQDRLLDVSAETDSSVELRAGFADTAITAFESSPIFGLGPGAYGTLSIDPENDDPHNVVLLQAAEGGVVLVFGFVVLILGSFWLLLRRRDGGWIVTLAIAVQVSTVAHGMVDVYWVRNTPVLGWVLVGSALVAYTQSSKAARPAKTLVTSQ